MKKFLKGFLIGLLFVLVGGVITIIAMSPMIDAAYQRGLADGFGKAIPSYVMHELQDSWAINIVQCSTVAAYRDTVRMLREDTIHVFRGHIETRDYTHGNYTETVVGFDANYDSLIVIERSER